MTPWLKGICSLDTVFGYCFVECDSIDPSQSSRSSDNEVDGSHSGISVILRNIIVLFCLLVAAVNSDGKDKNLASFWVPSLTPQAKPTLLKKPDTKTYCPMSGKPLRIKDLIPVKLTPIDDGDDRPMVAKSERYKCAVTHDALGNSVPCAVLKNTGHVVTMDCIEKLIKKDMLCPFTGTKLKESDIIPLQRGGTGYAGSGVQLEAKKAGPVLQA